MGAKQSSVDKLSLAEKRYKINSPKKNRRRSQQQKDPGNTKLRSTTSMSLDRTRSMDENVRVVHSSSMGKVPDSKGPIQQKSVDSLTPVQTPTVLLTMSPFFTDQQQIMSKQQRDLVENSWKRCRKDNVGSKVFLLVLIADPDIKMVFGLDKIPQGRLKYSPAFRKHAALITKSFDFAVKNLEYVEKLAHHFDGLGKSHVKHKNRGFKQEHWKTFSECMLQTTNEWLTDTHKCQKTVNAWKILIHFIIKHMVIGFEKEVLLRKRYLPTPIITSNSLSNPSALINLVPKTQSISSNSKKAQLLASRQPAICDSLCLPGRSANERSLSWVGTASFSEDFSRLRMTASQRQPKSRQQTAPEIERPESPNSEYFTPPSTRRTVEQSMEKKLLNSQHLTRYINA